MIAVAEVRHFGRRRHNPLAVKLRMTRLRQISERWGFDYADWAQLDTHCIRGETIWMDLKPMLETVWIALNRALVRRERTRSIQRGGYDDGSDR